MKTVPLDELNENDMVIWVCGSNFPDKLDPRHEQAMWGQCDTCRARIVHQKLAPEKAMKLCRTCAHLMHTAMAPDEDQEYVMTPEAKEQIEAMYGPGSAEKFHAECIRRLKEGE